MKRILTILALVCCLGATMPEVYAGVSRPAMEQTSSVRTGSGRLELSVASAAEAPVRFYVYSITGQMLKSVDVAPGQSVCVDVPQGYYIVKCADWSKQVVVRG